MLLSESSDNLSGVASSRSVLWTWIIACDFYKLGFVLLSFKSDIRLSGSNRLSGWRF